MPRWFVLMLLLFSEGCVYHDLNVAEIPPPPVCQPGEVSWQLDIRPLLTVECATSGCHDGLARRDWRDYTEVKQYADAIKTMTQNRSMPFDGPLSQHEIDLIACWVDDGAPEN